VAGVQQHLVIGSIRTCTAATPASYQPPPPIPLHAILPPSAALHGKHSCLCTGERSSFGKRPCASLCLWWCSTPADILPVHCKADANGACGGLKNPVCKSCSSTLQAVICRDIFIACFSVVYLRVFVQFVVSAPICQFCDWTWLV
jgi:hypothetical protein